MKIRNKIISVVLFVASVVLCFSSFNVGVVAAEGNRSWLWPVPSSSRLTSCFEDGEIIMPLIYPQAKMQML